jgi:hypothetical protein
VQTKAKIKSDNSNYRYIDGISMNFDLWIEASDFNLLPNLFELQPSEYNKIVLEKQKKVVSEGISLQYKSHYSCDSVDTPTMVIISIEIGKEIALPIALGILSSYLYDKLKERTSTLVINGKKTKIDKKEIERLILLNYSQEDERKFEQG